MQNEDCLEILPQHQSEGIPKIDLDKADSKIKGVDKKSVFRVTEGVGIAIAIVVIACFIGSRGIEHKSSTSNEDKSSQIAAFIESKVNTGGYTGCSCHSISNQVVQCDMNFPAGTSRSTVITNTQGVADLFAQIGNLASTIYYTGYSGSQRVCEFKYDMHFRTVKREF